MARFLRDYPAVSLKSEDIEGRLDFSGIFGRSGCVHVEVGSGRGTFLIHEARENPGIDFLGIEWANKYYRYAVDRIGRWGLGNVRVIRADAAVFIAEHLAEASVDCFHIYYPDPWPKKRHHKRRFVADANVEQMLRCLKAGGVIKATTDHEGYYEQMREVLCEEKWGLEEIEFVTTAGADDGENVGTNFERKYARQGRASYTIAVRKK